ncbi:MAG: carbonic anhydrase [Nitrospirales bacterium]|nr:MAG: carbonic anhydrase [Nitrospirales bacterium]
MKPLICIGGGGHARVLIDAVKHSHGQILGVVDCQKEIQGSQIFGVPVIGDDDCLARYLPGEVELINGIGSVGNPSRRKEIYLRLKKYGYTFASVMHPNTVIATDVKIDEGAQVMAGAILQPNVVVGCNVILNTRSSIDHDCIIHDHAHVAPGVILSGGVVIGEGVHLGVGAVVAQNITIGKDATIGAGAVVLKDVPECSVAWGVPAEVRKYQ